ncbi:MAG TPA: trypsin-like peptidase domain-containing protein [Candidatus Acidoferrales bacterium]|jgi:putative serine protease PepD|nr:trypsin-like peptidase domain-containing protein [Candidatus Acidoferrales bacterium]
MTPENGLPRTLRLLALGLIVGLGAYWAGARWGPRMPSRVEALPESHPDGEALSGEEAVNVRIYRQASPAVANIVTRAVEYDFFYNPVPVEGAGSGFLIDTNGHILTNYHVVQGAQTIEVILGDQTHYTGKTIGTDPVNDIALIQIDTHGHQLTPLPLGDAQNLQVGQRVLAIGNPFGFESTLTTGIVSALGRTVQTSETSLIDGAIQTDAAINRGNSGGPLLNSHGEVIGINTAIYTPSGTTAGIGFAIPINTARRVAEDLITQGRVRRAFLGIEGRALWPDLAKALDLPTEQGILVERATPGGPAAQAGIRGGTRTVLAGLQQLRIGGDVVVAVDGKKLTNQFELGVILNRLRPGDAVTLTIYRDQQKMDVRVTLTEGGTT